MSVKMHHSIWLGLLATSVSLPALADHEYEDRARVLSVTPQIERVNSPRQECRTEYVRESYYEAPRRSNAGAIVGGIAGGLIGSRFGGGNGRIATAAVGAGLGAVVGDRYDNRDAGYGRERVETRPVERCVTVDNWQSVTTGYLVNYEYNGRQYTTVTERDPGRFIPVNVAVRPSGYVTEVVYKPSKWDDDNHPGRGRGKQRDRQYW
ncbi:MULTISPECIES: glycine zipper 2TM domain-containing protein [unclassified Methylotenera]|uniref:glycine zipper 2TM domain-containing protein n=1 Tax=unclassified Methylotenera TaxID=2643294 RepID=UPI00039F76CD|nr:MULTISPECIES: glycine zipper 2TM domain-containing protein [unclassified Methylotenera]